jgi:hypothetical protein
MQRDKEAYRARQPTPNGKRRGSDRHLDSRPQAAQRRVAECDVAAVGPGDVAGDGETEPGAALVLLRASSMRRNGLNTSSRICSGMPGPSSSTLTVSQR